MQVHRLDVTIYAEDGWTWRTERIRNPGWNDIEVAIRRLDRVHYPFVWLFQNADADEDALPEFNVMGGTGEFYMDSYTDGSCYRYYDPSRGDGAVEIWQSDQGFTPEKTHCCSSLDTVLRATRYYCDHGALAPDIPWQSC